jgi:hypothetical protein
MCWTQQLMHNYRFSMNTNESNMTVQDKEIKKQKSETRKTKKNNSVLAFNS